MSRAITLKIEGPLLGVLERVAENFGETAEEVAYDILSAEIHEHHDAIERDGQRDDQIVRQVATLLAFLIVLGEAGDRQKAHRYFDRIQSDPSCTEEMGMDRRFIDWTREMIDEVVYPAQDPGFGDAFYGQVSESAGDDVCKSA